MADRQLVSHLRTALHNLEGEAIAIGAAVGDQMELVCRGGFNSAPVHERTVFYGASVTKQIIGAAAARAVLRGVVNIDDPITQWLPSLPPSIEAIRLDHLVHHTSGLPDLAEPTLGVPGGNAELLERFRHLNAPKFSPGTRFAYNNAGYVVLAEALAQSLGQPIDEIAGELVMPLGLSDTRFGGPIVQLQGRPDPPGTVGDGGLWTSIHDPVAAGLQRRRAWCRNPPTRRARDDVGDGSPVDYAWGVRVAPSAAGRVITHGGSWDMWLAKTVRIPERHVAVAILSVGSTELEISRTGTDLAAAIASR